MGLGMIRESMRTNTLSVRRMSLSSNQENLFILCDARQNQHLERIMVALDSFAPDELLTRGKADIDAIAVLLGDQAYLLG